MVQNRAVKPIFSTQGLKTTRPTLLRRATVIHANKTLLCTGHGHIMIKKADSWRSFHEYLKSSKIDQWCFSYIKLQDTGNKINQAIRNNEAIAIRDGSYKDMVGTAALIIEGTSSAGRIQSSVLVPGGASVQSSYRSELAGIYSTITIVNHICCYFNITEGFIEFAWDGLLALHKVFHSSKISLNDSDYDIIMAARRAVTISPIKWHTRHVRGHQDRDKAHQLDKWERLNIEVDAEARDFLHTAKRIPRHYIIGLEPWSLWYNEEKLSKIPSILYDLVHSREARLYWINKNKVP